VLGTAPGRLEGLDTPGRGVACWGWSMSHVADGILMLPPLVAPITARPPLRRGRGQRRTAAGTDRSESRDRHQPRPQPPASRPVRNRDAGEFTPGGRHGPRPGPERRRGVHRGERRVRSLRGGAGQYRGQHFCLDGATATSDGGGAHPYPLRDLGLASPSRSCRQPITRWCSGDCTRRHHRRHVGAGGDQR